MYAMRILDRWAGVRGEHLKSVHPSSPLHVVGTYVTDFWLVIFLMSVYVCVLVSYSVVDVVNRKKVKTPQTPLL